MSEWTLQRELTNWWIDKGHVELAGERFVLIAWEVMHRDWRINESTKPPWTPSIDFLLMDRHRQPVALELKNRVRGRLGAWELLCQVSHRAVTLAASYTPDRLEAAYAYCMSGSDQRVPAQPHETSRKAADRIFGDDTELPTRIPALRRFVMAQQYNRDWSQCADSFAAGDVIADGTLDRYLQRPEPPTELRRWANIGTHDREDLRSAAPITAVATPGKRRREPVTTAPVSARVNAHFCRAAWCRPAHGCR